MICYRDMTFCTAQCGLLSCPRKFTEAEREESLSWWGDLPGEPPIAFADFAATCPDHVPIAPNVPTVQGAGAEGAV
jgi:hypothetical protein